RVAGALRRVGRLPDAVHRVRDHGRGHRGGGEGIDSGRAALTILRVGGALPLRDAPGRAAASWSSVRRTRSEGDLMSDILEDLTKAGVSLWLDDLSRERLRTGSLQRMIEHGHISGVTSNPTIFANALGDGSEYADKIAELAARGADLDQTARTLMTDDVRDACDLFLPLFAS